MIGHGAGSKRRPETRGHTAGLAVSHAAGRTSGPSAGRTSSSSAGGTSGPSAGSPSRRPGRPPGQGFDLVAFRRLRFANGLVCPHCDSRRVHRWGWSGDRRRYRCLGCAHTFSDLTGTPLAHLKRLDLWPRFQDCVLESRTLRPTARALGVHLSTAFRWRHRLLAALRATDDATLRGEVVVAETCFPFSEKGRRPLDRPPRARGDRFWWLNPRVWVVVARDEAHQPWSDVVGTLRARVEELEQSLAPHLAPGVRIATHEGPYSATARFARLHGLRYRRLRGPELLQHPAWLYGASLRRWLAPFQGVASRYLPHYMAWHRFLVRTRNDGLDTRAASGRLLHACALR
jgi:transposase-like protein